MIIVDYYRVKIRHIEVHDLYNDREGGRYWYTRGWNLKAVAALIAGGVLSMLFQLSPTFANFSFFIGAIGSGLAYYAITCAERKATSSAIRLASPHLRPALAAHSLLQAFGSPPAL